MASVPPVRFRFARSEVEARPGETVLAALARRGWPSLSRSVRYHRPRGPFCGVGDCTGCLVRVNGVPNVRACQREVHAGDRVRTENAWPSPRLDGLGAIDLVLPHGLDTVHGLRRPRFLASVYQRFVRRLSGFGEPPDRGSATGPRNATIREAPITIFGAGRTGRATAEALVGAGARPLLVDRRREDRGGVDGAEFLGRTTAAILPPPADGPGGWTVVGSSDDGNGVVIRTGAVVVATGGYDAALLFEGSDRPGVVTADLALSDLGLPLGESVVVGSGPRARQVVEHLEEDVRAVVAFGSIDPDLAHAATERDIPLYPRSRLVRSVGRGHVRAVELSRRDGGGRFTLPCSSVVLAHRRLPNAQLLFQAGVARRWSEGAAAYYPEVDGLGRTALPGLFAVGSAARPTGVPAPSPGEVARAILSPGSEVGDPTVATGPRSELQSYYRELLREPRHGKWVVCPCEDVLLEEIERATERGFRRLEVAIRYTGIGTGLCQGRYCLPEAALLLSILEGREPPAVGYVTQRPPLVPTPLGALAAVSGEFDREARP